MKRPANIQKGLRAVSCLLAFLWIASACAPVSASLPEDTATPTLITPTPTATIVWFPPTNTPTPFPTREVTPTPELITGLGEILLTDEFTTAKDWTLDQTTGASAALGKNELTLAIQESKAYVTSVRSEPHLTNFYAEIIASPTLCSAGDEYGLLLRYANPYNYYRFSVTCGSRVRVERVLGGVVNSPKGWLDSGDLAAGAPTINKLAVWANGTELRFFINDAYQFTISDHSLPSGTLGVFAHSSGESALTVNFSKLVIRSVEQP